MTDFRKNDYKQVGYSQQNLLVNQRALRKERLNDMRRNRRSELFIAGRDNPQGKPHKEPFKKQEAKKVDRDYTNRLQTLAKWREERNQRKLLEKLRAKPPFKVGIVHHRWYSPAPIIKNVNMKNKQKPENVRSKKNKIIKKVPLSSMGHQFKAPIDFNAMLSPFDGRVAKKRVQMKNYFQNLFNDSVIKFLPEEIDTSTPTQIRHITNIDKGISPEQQEEEECTAQFYEYLLIQETERLIGLCNSQEHSKNEELTKGDDIYYLIEDCHARFKKLEEFESNND